MRSWFPLLLAVTAAHPASAQRTVRLALGGTWSSDLARDAVLDNTVLTLGVAPGGTVGVAVPITPNGSYRLVIEAGYSTSTLSASSDAGNAGNLSRVATISTVAMLDGAIHGALRWQAGGGLLFYRPAEKQGVFLDGGVRRYQLAGGMSWTHPLTPVLSLLILGRYSFHEFITPVLGARGYSSYQSIHRAGLQVGVERRF